MKNTWGKESENSNSQVWRLLFRLRVPDVFRHLQREESVLIGFNMVVAKVWKLATSNVKKTLRKIRALAWYRAPPHCCCSVDWRNKHTTGDPPSASFWSTAGGEGFYYCSDPIEGFPASNVRTPLQQCGGYRRRPDWLGMRLPLCEYANASLEFWPLRGPTNPLAGQPVDWPRSARPIEEYP